MTVRTTLAWLALSLLSAGAGAMSCEAATLYIETAMTLTIDGEEIPEGRIIVEDGRITAVGADLERPPFSRRIDAGDLTVMPGFVVPVSGIGMPSPPRSRNRPGSAVRIGTSAKAKAADDYRAGLPDHVFLQQQGVTTIGLLPVSTGVGIKGQLSAYVTGPGNAKELELRSEAGVYVRGAAHGPWRKKISEAFEKAAKAKEAEDEKAEKDGKKKAKKSRDPIVRLLQKKAGLFLSVSGGAEWLAASDAMPLKDMDVTVFDSARLFELVDELAESKVRVLTFPALVNRRRTRFPVNRAAEYEKAGIPFAFRLATDTAKSAAQLRDAAIEMHRLGCSREAVLRALTSEPAKALGLGDKVGAVSKGHRADLLFFSGDPLDPLSRLELVMSAGEEVELVPLAGGGA
jgi:imidazolonepropionase-like amidohydrolase